MNSQNKNGSQKNQSGIKQQNANTGIQNPQGETGSQVNQTKKGSVNTDSNTFNKQRR